MKVPIVIVSRGARERFFTSQLLGDIPHTVVFHTDEQYRQVSDLLGSGAWVETSGARTVVEQRNFVLEAVVKRDKWFIGMDDNIRRFTAASADILKTLRQPTQESGVDWRAKFNRTCKPKRYLDLLTTDIQKAEADGIPLVGVSTMENPYFRSKRYAHRRFVKTKLFAMKNVSDLRFEYELCHDTYISALAVARYGSVLVDQYLHHEAKMYESGGIGTLQQRKDAGLDEQLRQIMNEFPGLLMEARGANSALRFRLTHDTSIRRWREKHGYL